MPQEENQQPGSQSPMYLSLQMVEREIGMSRVTLRKYLRMLDIEPKSWHIGDRSLYISQEEKERVRQLKENPALLEQLRSPTAHAS